MNQSTLSFVDSVPVIGSPERFQSDVEHLPTKIKLPTPSIEVVKVLSGSINRAVKAMAIAQLLGLVDGKLAAYNNYKGLASPPALLSPPEFAILWATSNKGIISTH